MRVALEGVLPFVAAGLLFGLLYNTLFYPHTPVEYFEAATIGLILGAMAGVAEQLWVVRRWLQQRSFAEGLLARTLAYSIATALTLSLVLSVEPATEGECAYVDCFLEYVRSPLFARDLVYSTAFVFLATFLAQLILLVGARDVGRLLTGRYQRPRELRAAFMFVDLRGSTALGEAMGHERFSALLRDFFIDVSGAIHQAGGEVYQYIGDEVIVVWPAPRKAGRWLYCFTAMRASIARERDRYLATYQVVPEFKAGVHEGAVVVTEVGALQRAHVYHGDVLNTAARLQALCNEAGFDLLASGDAVSALRDDQRARFEPIAPVALRGKSQSVSVFGLTEARHDRAALAPATGP